MSVRAARGPGSLLSCEKIRKTYTMGEVEVRALDGVDLTLRAGELLVHEEHLTHYRHRY